MKQHQFRGVLKIAILLLCLPVATQWAAAETAAPVSHKEVKAEAVKQEVISLSQKKWQWMSEKNLDALSALFHNDSMFVHMSRTLSKTEELEVIKSGNIQYKKADIHEVSVKIIDKTAILLNSITLLAVVRGNEVTNPFVVTEVYVKQNGNWKLTSLSFTKTVVPEPAKQ